MLPLKFYFVPFLLLHHRCTTVERVARTWDGLRLPGYVSDPLMQRYAANTMVSQYPHHVLALRKGLLAMAGATCKFGDNRNFPCGLLGFSPAAAYREPTLAGSSIVVVSVASD